MKKIKKLCIFSSFMAVVFVGVCGLGYADSRNEYSGYPLSFDGSGTVDMFDGEKSISINDSAYKITDKTIFNRPGNLNCLKIWFKKNDFVYYVLEPDSQTIKSLWCAKDRDMGIGAP